MSFKNDILFNINTNNTLLLVTSFISNFYKISWKKYKYTCNKYTHKNWKFIYLGYLKNKLLVFLYKKNCHTF